MLGAVVSGFVLRTIFACFFSSVMKISRIALLSAAATSPLTSFVQTIAQAYPIAVVNAPATVALMASAPRLAPGTNFTRFNTTVRPRFVAAAVAAVAASFESVADMP